MPILNYASRVYLGSNRVSRIYMGAAKVYDELENELSSFLGGTQDAIRYEIGNLSTLFQDGAWSIPVTGIGDLVGSFLDMSGRGHHAYQSDVGARATLKKDAYGKYYLETGGNAGFYNISVPMSFNESIIGFALSPLPGIGTLLSSGAGGGYIRSFGTDYYRASGGAGLAAKDRQAFILLPQGASSTSTALKDSTGESAVCTGHAPGGLSGASGHLFSTSAPADFINTRFYGLIARSGPSTGAEQALALRYLDSLLGEVSP